jgi:hypothetical protein
MLNTMYLRTISCLQNTLIYIIIVCKQTSALHITNHRIYHILRKHGCEVKYNQILGQMLPASCW